MTSKLFFEAILKFLLGIVLVGLLVFLPAGTFYYFNGWLFMGFLFIPIFIAGIVMMIKNPELLKKRLNAKEKEEKQGLVVKLSGLMFIAGFVLSGLGYRFGRHSLDLAYVWQVSTADYYPYSPSYTKYDGSQFQLDNFEPIELRSVRNQLVLTYNVRF